MRHQRTPLLDVDGLRSRLSPSSVCTPTPLRGLDLDSLTVQTNPDVDAWFAQLAHPLKPAMQRVREIILAADPRMTELVQYGTVQFVYVTALCNFVQVKNRKHITIMFNVGGRIPGEFPHLEAAPNSYVRHMRLVDLSDVEARAEELRAITIAWCNYKTG
jgi:hypothetical protein